MKVRHMIKGNAKKYQIIVLLEIIVLVSLGIAIVVQLNRNDSILDISLSDWKATSSFIYDTDGWYVDESMLEAGMDADKKICLYGPYFELSRGTYSVYIEYECEHDQFCQIYANDINNTYINGRAGNLSKNYKKMSYEFMVTEDIDNFEFIVDYNKEGYLWIKNIEIQRNSAGLQRVFTVIIFLITSINAWFYYRNKRRKVFLEIIGMILLISIPLFVSGVCGGHDIDFHFMRIEGLAEELRRGVFPVKMSSLWMDGYGYPVSVFYGDLLLYMAAALRIIGFSVVTAYKSYVFMINAGTVIISYSCFNRMFKSNEIAVITTLAYITAGYRNVCIFVRSAAGEYSAMMFLPLIAFAIYQFYTLESDDWKVYKRYAFVLAVGMTGVVGSHILSTEMVIITLAAVCIVFWKHTFKKNILCGYLLALAETIVLNLYFIIPLLDYYMNVKVSANTSIDNIQTIQEQGAYIGQYFFFFQDMFGQSGSSLSSRMSLTPGMALMFGLIIAITFWMNGKATKEIKIFSVFAIFVLFMASDLFPWNHLGLHYKWGKILSQIQFPWRYIGIAIVFLTMLLGSICKLIGADGGNSKKFSLLIICSCLIMEIFYTNNYSNRAWMVYYYDTAELDTYAFVGGEYLRAWTDVSSLQGQIMQENMQGVSLISREGTYMEIYCESSEAEGIVEVPMLNYKGYKVWDEYGKEYEIRDGNNNVIQFSVPAGFSGKIKIDFVEPWYWRVGELVSLAAVICMCVWKLKEVSMLYFRMNRRDEC